MLGELRLAHHISTRYTFLATNAFLSSCASATCSVTLSLFLSIGNLNFRGVIFQWTKSSYTGNISLII